ncbi:MAG: hypothetical protein LBQ15_02760 [Clostridium sp.]|jgi:hypothetical protein|nr:hypothetical protein [Clostridium sp.]
MPEQELPGAAEEEAVPGQDAAPPYTEEPDGIEESRTTDAAEAAAPLYTEYPAYFRQILLEREGLLPVSFQEGSADSYFDSGLSATDENRYVFQADEIRLKEGKTIRGISIVLDEYVTKIYPEETLTAEPLFVNNIFYDEKTGLVYLLFICGADSTPPQANTGYYAVLAEFPVDTPQDCRMQEISISGENQASTKAWWFTEAYLLEGRLYHSFQRDLAVIDLQTRKAWLCEAQSRQAQAYVRDVLGKNGWMGFRARGALADVTVYQMVLAESNDTPLLATCYFAYAGEELIDIMVIDETTQEIRLDTPRRLTSG